MRHFLRIDPVRMIPAMGMVLVAASMLFLPDARGATRLKGTRKPLPLDLLGYVRMKTPENSRYIPGRVIVKVEPSGVPAKGGRAFGLSALDAFAQRYSVQSVSRAFPEATQPLRGGDVDLSGIYVMRYSAPLDAFAVAKELSELSEVEYAEPWFIYQADDAPVFTPNDSLYFRQWALVRIKADSAWSVSTGDTSVVIGIVDTGVQWDHPDLAANIWINPGETGLDAMGHDKRTNGIDDDNDGKIDDWHGWDFGGADYNAPIEDNNPYPSGSNTAHGTHVAGIASAVTNNTTGIAGVGYKCRILPVKTSADNDVRGSGGSALIIAGFQGIAYAAEMGAKVINCSWGGPGASQFEQDVVNFATQHGALVVAAAGNGNATDPNYPAAYANVLSVGATNTSDVKTYYSNYGPAVDLCAPGGDFSSGNSTIFSTYYPSTYGGLAGTSQASPHVTGVAALVKSMFPAYTPLQVGEQVRVTCDDINSINPAYVNKLGKGRVNAYRALTSSSPSLRLTSISLQDSVGGNNNGVPEPNETISLIGTFANYLQPTSGSATITLSTADTNVQIIGGIYPIGAVATLGTLSNASSPFTFHVGANVAQSYAVDFTLTISDGGYHDYQAFSLVLNPSYATHDINNVQTTFTNNGNIGFYDFPYNTQGVGFVYGGDNQLFEGGLLIGYSSTKLVDVVRNDVGGQDLDFSSHQVYRLKTPGLVSDQDGGTVFADSAASVGNRVGVRVNMYSYAFAADPNRDYVIIRYDIRNISGGMLTNFYAGLFLDWDMHAPDLNNDSYFDHNKTWFDASRDLGYAWYDTTAPTIYCGVRALDGAAGYIGVVRDSITASRAEKWSWLSGGIKPNQGTNDIHFVISSGPYTLGDGGTQTLGFALLGGASLPALQAHADSALQKWYTIKSLLGARPRLSVAIHQNPELSRYADLYVTSDVTLAAAPSMLIKVGAAAGDSVRLAQVSPGIFKGSYQFSSSGTSTITVSAIGLNGLDTVATRTFQVQFLKRGLAATVSDPNGRARVQFPEGALDEDTYVTVLADEPSGSIPPLIGEIFSFGPRKTFSNPMSLTLTYARDAVKSGSERNLHIYQESRDRWVPLQSWVDPGRLSVTAPITSLGRFALGYDEHALTAPLPTSYTLEQNFPNPFNPQTTIRFGMPQRGSVRLTIYDLVGREVSRLVDDERDAGWYEVIWDGMDARENPVASGVYFYTLQVTRTGASSFSKTEKLIIVK